MKLPILVLILFIISSCKGQSNPPETNDTISPFIFKQKGVSNTTDPLLYIQGQLCQHLRKIFQDSQGILWFGTNVYDIMRYDGDSLVYLTEVEGFSGGRVTGILEDNEGSVWIATGFGLNRFDGNSFQIFTKDDGLDDDEIWSIHLDKENRLWIGHNAGLCVYDGSTFKEIPIVKPHFVESNTIYSKDRIVSITGDREGNIWLGTDGFGILKFDGTGFQSFTTEDGLSDNTVAEIFLDSQGYLWIGTFFGGVSVFDGISFKNYTQEGIVEGEEVGAFYEDDNGDIWFGVENNGVYRYDGQTFHHYYKDQGLDAIVLSIYKDRNKRFWFGGWGGLFRFDGSSFTSVTKDGPWE